MNDVVAPRDQRPRRPHDTGRCEACRLGECSESNRCVSITLPPGHRSNQLLQSSAPCHQKNPKLPEITMAKLREEQQLVEWTSGWFSPRRKSYGLRTHADLTPDILLLSPLRPPLESLQPPHATLPQLPLSHLHPLQTLTSHHYITYITYITLLPQPPLPPFQRLQVPLLKKIL